MSKLIDQIGLRNTQILLKKIMAWVTGEKGIRGNSGHIHFCDGLWQIRGDLSETFPTAIYDVVATGTSSWAVQNVMKSYFIKTKSVSDYYLMAKYSIEMLLTLFTIKIIPQD